MSIISGQCFFITADLRFVSLYERISTLSIKESNETENVSILQRVYCYNIVAVIFQPVYRIRKNSVKNSQL